MFAGLPAPRVPRPRFGHLLRGVHHRPCGRLAAPERPRASPYQAFSSRRSASLSEDPALLTLRSSHRLAPRWSETDGAAFRASIPTSSSFAATLASLRAAACLGFTPPELSLLPSSHARCRPRAVPHHALGGIDVPTRLRLGVFRCGRPGIVPLGTAGSPGVSHLMTVVASLRPPRGAGVWLGCPVRAFALARTELYAPSLHGPAGTWGPDPTPPSFGERLLPLPVVRACLSKNRSSKAPGVPVRMRDRRISRLVHDPFA